MPSLTKAQRRAIEDCAHRLQIPACAGSGKTEVLARRAVRFLTEGHDPAGLIAFTFTEKAARELKTRIEARAAEADEGFRERPPAARGMFVGTTHGWALQALQNLGGDLELFDTLTEEREWVLLHRFGRRLGIVDLYAAAQNRSPDEVSLAQAIDPFLRSMEVVHHERPDRAELARIAPVFAEALDRYEDLLAGMRLLPFRLMIGRAIDELEPGGRLRRGLEGRVSHVLVDEFQDFNPAQDRLLSLLADLGASLTVVGDDDQAIYQWRGGDVSLFVRFAERYPGATAVPLAKNHRSRPEIVDFARQVVESLPDRQPKSLLAARPRLRPGAVESLVADTAKEEADRVAARIAGLVRAGHRPRDVAILFRSVRTSARPFRRALDEHGVRFVQVGTSALLDRPEMALIARILISWAGGSWFPEGHPPPERITPGLLREGIRAVTKLGPGAAAEALRQSEALGEEIHRRGCPDSVALLSRLLQALGLPGTGPEAKRHEQGLGRMSTLLKEFDHSLRRSAPVSAGPGERPGEEEETPPVRPGTEPGEQYLRRLKDYLQAFAGRSAEEGAAAGPDEADAVRIMTVHQAKGLEFPVVFVPCLIEGRFPSSKMGTSRRWYLPDDFFDRNRYEGREEDEARLLYVALTRARDLLVVSRFRRHPRKAARPSRYLPADTTLFPTGTLPLGSARPAPMVRETPEEPLDLDFSTLVAYRHCPHDYWLRHVCGFAPPLARELGFGKLLHHVIAELARGAVAGRVPTARSADAILDRSFYLPFAGSTPARNLRESIRKRVHHYLEEHGGELLRTIEPEARFEVPLAGARIHGRIDLLLAAEGGGNGAVELIDFKSSSDNPPPAVHVDQLRVYAEAVRRQGYEPVRLAIHELAPGGGRRTAVPRDEGRRLAFERELGSWVAGIRRNRFLPAADRAACRGCDFRGFCRHASARRRRG